MRVRTSQHPSFSSYLMEQAFKRRRLSDIKQLLDEDALAAELQGLGKDYAAVPLFLALLLQHMHNVSDEEAEATLHDSLSWMAFCGYELESEKPSAATLCRFRNRVHKAGIWDRLLESLNEQLSAKGVAIKQGTHAVCDATVVSSCVRPPSSKSQADWASQTMQARSEG